MLLLQMFTWMSFVVVFLPLLVFVPIFIGWFVYSMKEDYDEPGHVVCPSLVMLLPIPSIVLLMLKTDAFLGIGTAFWMGDALTKFSWVIVMVPIWVSIVIF